MSSKFSIIIHTLVITANFMGGPSPYLEKTTCACMFMYLVEKTTCACMFMYLVMCTYACGYHVHTRTMYICTCVYTNLGACDGGSFLCCMRSSHVQCTCTCIYMYWFEMNISLILSSCICSQPRVILLPCFQDLATTSHKIFSAMYPS